MQNRNLSHLSPKLQRTQEAINRVSNGARVMIGGFGLVGSPLTLLAGLAEAGTSNLTVISNNLGEPGQGLGRLVQLGSVRRAIGSFFTSNPKSVELHQAGQLELELIPQGILAESMRVGGAGIAAFYARTGVGTLLAKGREEREFGGKPYLLWPALRADVALIRAHKADALGNLVYRKTARNFNPVMATAADLVIAEVDEIVPTGALSPEEIVTPHLFVDILVQCRYGVDREEAQA